MKYFKQLDDKTWVSFDEGEDMEWEELLDGLKLGFFIYVPLISAFCLICWLFEVLG